MRSSDRSLTFLHNLIPTWLTNKGKAGKLFIDKTVAGQYLSKIFTEILSVAGNAPLQPLTTLDKKLEDYVSRVAVRFLCRHGDEDSLKLVSSCLTSFRFLEQRVHSGRIEIYHLLEDLKLAAGCYGCKDTQRQNILQEISLALESNVHVLLECPHLLHSCLLNCSNAVHENVLIPQVSGPWLEWELCDFSSIGKQGRSMTCSFSGLSNVIASIRSALGEQTKRLLRFLGVDPEVYQIKSMTGTGFESVSGRNLVSLTKEGQVGYFFRSGTEERALFLKDFNSPFKFLPSLSATTSAVKKSIAAIFSSSVTVKSVSSDSLVALWHITDKGIFFLSECSLVDFPHPVLQNCVFSPNGKVIACQRGNQIELHSLVAESVHESRIMFQQHNAFTGLFSFSADSTLLLFCIQGDNQNSHFYLWDVENKIMVASFRSPGLLMVECFCLSADKTKLILCREYEIEIWEYHQQPRRLLTRTGVERSYRSVKFSKCAVSLDNELLICCIANIIILFSLCAPDVHSSKRVHRGHLGKIEFCKILRVNRYLISYGVDGMVFLWDLIETKAIGFARITQGNESIVSMVVSPEEDRAVCFTSSDRICRIKLCKLAGDLSTTFLTIEAKDKVAAIYPRFQLAEEIATSKILIPSTEDDEFSSTDSEEDTYCYYLEI